MIRIPVPKSALLRNEDSRLFIVAMSAYTPRELEEAHGARFEGGFETREETEAEAGEMETRREILSRLLHEISLQELFPLPEQEPRA